MISRHSGLGLSVALSLASVSVTFDALAQGFSLSGSAEASPTAASATASAEAPPPAAPPSSEPAPAPPEPAPPAATEPAAPPTAEQPAAAEAPTATAEATAAAPATPTTATDAAPTTASGTSPQREEAVTLLGLELLPGSAYPSAYTRGIKYGSLWRTFHGQQWPYMPLIGAKPGMRVGFSGYVWNDLARTSIDVDKSLSGAGLEDQTRATTQTRGMVRVTPTYNAGGDWFAQGNAELVVWGDQIADVTTGAVGTTDDLFVRVGKWNVFDVTVGRFQGWEIANHYGMALDQNTFERSGALVEGSSGDPPTDGYGLSYFWDRQNYKLGGYAVHVYPTKYLRGEVLGHVGYGGSQSAGTPYQMDIRPAAIFDVGFLKVKAGWEWGKVVSQKSNEKLGESKNGFGVAAQVVLDPYVELGGSFARGFTDVVDIFEAADLAASTTAQTVGGFLNASPGYEPLVLGFGAFLNHIEDMRIDNAVGPHQGKADTNDQWLLYGAAQYTLWDHLYLKLVAANASNKVDHYSKGSYVNNAFSTRLRVELLF